MIRLLIADDHKLFRIGLHKMLREAQDIKVVGEARTGEEAVTLARELAPNIVLMDICMPGIGGLEATRRITQRDSGMRVVMLTGFRGESLSAAGAESRCGRLPDEERLMQTSCSRPSSGFFSASAIFPSEIAQQLAVTSFEEVTEDPFGQLSSREMQIMLMVVNCQKVKEISSNLHLSPKTVNSYRYRIFEKLNVGSDVELALMAVRYGVVNGGSSSSPLERCQRCPRLVALRTGGPGSATGLPRRSRLLPGVQARAHADRRPGSWHARGQSDGSAFYRRRQRRLPVRALHRAGFASSEQAADAS